MKRAMDSNRREMKPGYKPTAAAMCVTERGDMLPSFVTYPSRSISQWNMQNPLVCVDLGLTLA